MKKILLLVSLCIFSLCTIQAEITWSLSKDGTLTISGTDMSDYELYSPSPWYYQREKIKKIVIEKGVTNIGKLAFYACSNLTAITIPNSVTRIGNSAFSSCSGLTSVTIPNSVTSIGEYAIAGCSGLTSITIPNSVTNIGGYAFFDCSNLTSITIPSTVTSIGQNALLKTKWYEEQPDGIVYAGVFLLNYKGTMPANIKIEIKDETKIIGDYAFYGCSGLTSISIPNSVTSIGEYAFAGCSGLTSVSIPNSVTSIGEHAFSDCHYLTSVIIGNSVKSIASYTFYNCSNLTSVTMENSVTNIRDYAFSGCLGLTSISLPESVTGIGNYAFNNCSDLVSINIPNSVSAIGDYAFYQCSDLVSINIPNSLREIGKYAFAQSNISSAFIPESVESIGVGAFRYCPNLTSVNIPNSITKIASHTFDGCWKLTSVTIGNSVTSIGGWAFYDCNELTSITIPNSVKSLGSYALSCSGLTSITCEAIVPPVCATNSFQNVNVNIPLFVPANSINAYKTASIWRDFTNIQEIPDNQKKADLVVAKISAIGKVEYTDACKNKIDDATTAYNTLTEDQKALVSNLDVLTTAQQAYDNLKAAAEKLAADKAKADPVIAKINAIGKVEYTDACKNKIDEANNAYNALTADQKALVTNLDVLTIAKQTYDILKAAAEKLAADKAAFDKYKAELRAIIEAFRKDGDSDAVKTIINIAISDIDAVIYDVKISLDDNKVKINSFATSVNEAVEKQRAEDEKATGVEELELAEKVNIYDLNGRKITNSMLKLGLYIRNGKKMVVK